MRKINIEVPQSRLAEKAVVACCIWEPTCIPLIFEICSVTDFIDPNMKVFIKAIHDVWNADMAVDLVTVEQKIREGENFGDEQLAEWQQTISSDTMNCLPSASNAEYYAKIVREKRYERDLIRELNALNETVFDKALDIKEKKELFDQAVLSLNFEADIKDQDVAAIAKRIWESTRPDKEDESDIWVASGYEKIEEQIGGFGPGELIIVAARPSNGKSTMLMEMAMAISLRRPVLILSMEMNQESIVLRMLSQMTCLPILKIKSGNMTDEQQKKYEKAVKDIGRYKIYIDDSALLSPASVAAKVMKAKAIFNIGCVMVDYIQLMHIPKWRSDNRVQEITRISNELRATAKRARIPLIAASQMSRAIESRADGEPRLSDLRESGAIEQDADYVFFLYPYIEDREEYKEYQPGINEPRQHCCKIAKCRQGPRDIKINLYWRPALYTFKDTKEAGELVVEQGDDIPF